MAVASRQAARDLLALPGSTRKAILKRLSEMLLENKDEILAENQKDIDAAKASSLDSNLLSRLVMSPAKLQTLAKGIAQIAEQEDPIGFVKRRTQVAEGLLLEQVAVPLGVLLVIFESRPDALPQIAALSIYAGDGLILKGGKEAMNSNIMLHGLVAKAITEVTKGAVDPALVSLVTSRDDISKLLQLQHDIDLVIPRGSNALVTSIQNNTRIPVMGHSEGVCHMYIDAAADADKAAKLCVDAKTDYPAACNALETLLINQAALSSATAPGCRALEALKAAGVTMFGGPLAMASDATKGYMAGPADFRSEYGDLRISVEVVPDMKTAIAHINRYGSSHTDVIVSEDKAAAQVFLNQVDSACVFHNASNRFADGFRFGLGAEVGISTSRLHARGPVGVEGLTSTKWRMVSALDAAVKGKAGEVLPTCHTVADFASGDREYVHAKLDL